MNERELLLTRLEYLKDVVDVFVIVEADMTFQGEPRTLDFPDVRARITLGEDRIRYVTVTGLPVEKGAWECERRVRDAILEGLVGIDGEALVLISDIDEIADRDLLVALAKEVVTPVALKFRYFTYKVDWEWLVPWVKPRALRRRHLVSPDDLRRERGLPMIENAGWHMSWLGDEDRVREKIESFSHTEMRDLLNSPHHVRMCVNLGVDLLGRGVLRQVTPAEAFPGFPRKDYPTLWAPPRTSRQLISARLYNFAVPGLRKLSFPTDPIRFTLGVLLSAPVRVWLSLRTSVGALRNTLGMGRELSVR